MDADFPYPAPPLPPPDTPPAPPREPAWSGLELAVIVLFTLLAIITVSVVALLSWAIFEHATGWSTASMPELELVAITLIGQTAGILAGFLLAWSWIGRGGKGFWGAIHWKRLPPEGVLAMIAGGAGMMVAVQILGHVLPMPSDVPMDQLFTPHTAWLLLAYGMAVAPFFEEFFFRGLLYPTLRSAFDTGVTGAELRAWHSLLRLLAAFGLAAAAYWHWRRGMLGYAATPGVDAGFVLALAAGLIGLAVPQWPLAAAGWVFNQIARWRHPQLLAILITGLLFGLLHASQLGWAWSAVLILMLVGVVLTMVRAFSGSLMASWIFHCAYNGALFAAQYVSTSGFHHFSQGPH